MMPFGPTIRLNSRLDELDIPTQMSVAKGFGFERFI